MSNSDLMRAILSDWQPAIAAAVKDSAVPAELVAALIANESGGNPNVTRFEPIVFAELSELLAGKRQLYAPPGISRPLAATDLLPFVTAGQVFIGTRDDVDDRDVRAFFTQCLGRVVQLATSYSLTQIMGWHWLEFSRPASMRPEDQLAFTVVLLTYFANKYTLDLGTDAGRLLHCWNTGTPEGHTYDPQYVPNGLARLDLYRSLLGQDVSAS